MSGFDTTVNTTRRAFSVAVYARKPSGRVLVIHHRRTGHWLPIGGEMEAGETNPFRVLLSRLFSTAYLWHNYGNSTIGARAGISTVQSSHGARISPASPSVAINSSSAKVSKPISGRANLKSGVCTMQVCSSSNRR